MPSVNPVTVVLNWVGFVIVADPPVSFVHNPVPGEGLFPASVVDVIPEQQ